MLMHQLQKLRPKTLSSIVGSPYWPVLYKVGFCDRSSQIPGLSYEKYYSKNVSEIENKFNNLANIIDPQKISKRTTWKDVQIQKRKFLNEYQP